jgi:hypothetical protein
VVIGNLLLRQCCTECLDKIFPYSSYALGCTCAFSGQVNLYQYGLITQKQGGLIWVQPLRVLFMRTITPIYEKLGCEKQRYT